jgi:hypothetical protein
MAYPGPTDACSVPSVEAGRATETAAARPAMLSTRRTPSFVFMAENYCA